MLTLLILSTTLNAAPPPSCAALAYCMAEARERFCAIWPDGAPAKVTVEEGPVHALAKAMEAQGCPLPESRLRCPVEAPARAAPPVDCAKIAVRD